MTDVENAEPATPLGTTMTAKQEGSSSVAYAYGSSPATAGIWADSTRRNRAMVFNPATAAMGAHPFMQHRVATGALLRTGSARTRTQQEQPATSDGRTPFGAVQGNVAGSVLTPRTKKAAGALLSPRKGGVSILSPKKSEKVKADRVVYNPEHILRGEVRENWWEQVLKLQWPDLACCSDACRSKGVGSKEQLYGVGMNFQETGKGEMTVVSLTPGSSAARSAEIEIGDQLVEVNGVYVYRGRLDQVRGLMLGQAGTRVPIKLRRLVANKLTGEEEEKLVSVTLLRASPCA
jgi:hypothetical protein